jgi:hypothetical protein
MAVSFQGRFEEINTIIKDGETEIDGGKHKVRVFLGGDYKVIDSICIKDTSK